MGEQGNDQGDGSDRQQARMERRRSQAGSQAALALQQGGGTIEGGRQGAARFAGADQTDIELGEAPRLAGKRRRKRAAAADLVANIVEDTSGARASGILDDKPQGAVEILSRPQHDRELAGDLAERR